jgi:hypothetical protein
MTVADIAHLIGVPNKSVGALGYGRRGECAPGPKSTSAGDRFQE